MDQLNDPSALYKDLLLTSFEKISKALPKKYKEIRELLGKFKEQAANDKDNNSNKYFLLYKYCIETKNTKLIEICLYYIQKLISHGFLNGNCKDYTYGKHIEEYVLTKSEALDQEKNRKLIDAIVESICFCQIDKDDNVQLQIVKVLLTLVTSSYCEVHDKSLLEAFRAFYNIFITSKNNNNQTSARAALTQMMHVIFQKMEGANNSTEDPLLKKKPSNPNTTLSSSSSLSSSNLTQNSPTKLTSKPISSLPLHYQETLGNKPISTTNTPDISKTDISSLTRDEFSQNSIYDGLNNDNNPESAKTIMIDPGIIDAVGVGSGIVDPLESYIHKTLRHIVDDVCIYNEKVEMIKAKVVEGRVKGEGEGEEEKEREGGEKEIEMKMKEDIENIPLRTVPLELAMNNQKYKNLTKVNLLNEKGITSDIFGWCFVCRNPAKLYCKDTKIPICSVECKNKHLQELGNLYSFSQCIIASPLVFYKQDALECYINELPARIKPNPNLYLTDAVQFFKMLCKLSGKEQSRLVLLSWGQQPSSYFLISIMNSSNMYTLRSKILLLEMILAILDNPGTNFLSRKEFTDVIKNNLCESILKNTVNTEKQVVGLSLGIFVNLVKHFREYLKQEISVFIDNIFLKLLESGNTSYHHRLVALQVFYALAQRPTTLLEFYVNYDCDVSQTNIVEKIIEFLGKFMLNLNQRAKGREKEEEGRKDEVEGREGRKKEAEGGREEVEEREKEEEGRKEEEVEGRKEEREEEVERKGEERRGEERRERGEREKKRKGFFPSKIAQGKYSKSEYIGVVNQKEENNLKILALESMLAIVKNLVLFSEDYEKKMEENRKRLLEGDTNAEKDINEETSSTGGDEIKDTNFDKVDAIEKARILKNELQKAIQKFNFKTKAGIKYLINLGIIRENNAKDLANFIKNTSQLSKEKIGEYFGEEHQINIDVLTEYTESIDYKGMQMDEALRVFLNGFDLPGESQKVDRIMQIFAGKYVRDNPEIFTSSTGAYQMAYLLMMLQTDAHNPQVKEKMKLSDFTKLAKGLNDEKELSPEILSGFYHRILKNPLALPTTEKLKKHAIDQARESIKKKQENFLAETAILIEKGKELIKSKSTSAYILINNTDYVHSLVEIFWSPLLAVLSIVLEQNEDSKLIQLCLDGFIYATKLTGMYSMNTERDAFVLSLVKFTSLTSFKQLKKRINFMLILIHYHSNREIKEKNLKCIKTLLYIAVNQGNYLKSSWIFILDCISKIDYLIHYTPLYKREDNGFFSDLSRAISKSEANDQIDTINSEIIKNNIDLTTIDFIFSKSSNFKFDEIIEFITGLCKISEEELKNPLNQRTFSLQKLVEVAHFNMNRMKFIWSQIWNIMKEYFSKVGLHQNKQISMFAIDSLKQLAIKFLKQDELASSDFQKQFLKPFESIFIEIPSENSDIKDLILSCIDNIISHSNKTLKSGWKIIFDILNISATSDRDLIVESGFKITQKIINENLVMNDYLIDLLSVVLRFIRNKNEEIIKESLDSLNKIITNIANAKIAKLTTNVKDNQILLESSNDIDPGKDKNNTNIASLSTIASSSYNGLSENIWMKIFGALLSMTSDSRPRVQNYCLNQMFMMLGEYGESFSRDFWQMILSGIIKPLFDEIQYSIQSKKINSKEQVQAFRDFCEKAFVELIKLYNYYFDKLRCFTEEIFDIISNCIQNPQESLAKVSISALKYMINTCSDKFQPNEWEIIVIIIQKTIMNTTPTQLLESKSIQLPINEAEKSLKFNSVECITKCVVQLLMIGIIKDIVEKYYEKFSIEQIERFLNLLESSFKFARTFNDQIYFRYCLWKNGIHSLRKPHDLIASLFLSIFVNMGLGFNQEMQQLPGLLKQEKEGLSVYLTILFTVYTKSCKEGPERARFLDKFIEIVLKILENYYTKHNEFLDSIKKLSTKHIDQAKLDEHHHHPQQQPHHEDDDSIENLVKKLKLHELERDIANLKSLISMVIIPKLVIIDISELKHRVKALSHALINLSVYSFCKSYACYMEPSQPNCLKNSDSGPEATTDIIIRQLLMKYFDHCIDYVNNSKENNTNKLQA